MSREKEIYKVTLWGSLVNALLMVFKFVAGMLGNSAAMMADAVHSVSDFANGGDRLCAHQQQTQRQIP